MRSQKFVINCCGLRPPESQSELHWNMAASIFNQKEFPQHNHTSYKKRFYTIECYEGQREGTYEERKHLGASFQPGCAQVHGALMCFFQYNAPTELLITKFTVCAGGGCSTQVVVFPQCFSWGMSCSSTLQTTSRWIYRGRWIHSPVELIPGYCHLLKFLSKSNLPVKGATGHWGSVIASSMWFDRKMTVPLLWQWLSCFCHFLLKERNSLECTINCCVVLHEALLVLEVSFY